MKNKIKRLIKATKIIVKDRRIPRPLRGLAAFAVLPIPGPIDEIVLILVGFTMWLFYRDIIREAWLTTNVDLVK